MNTQDGTLIYIGLYGNVEVTKEMRHNIYVEAKKYYIKLYDPDIFIGMCKAITITSNKLNIYIPALSLPEFLSIKPDGAFSYHYWWPIEDIETRIKMFDKLIEMTK